MDEKITTLRSLGAARLGTGLGQGVLLYLLYLAVEFGIWPATQGLVFAPLLMLAWFLPLILLAGLGSMRPRTLLRWIAGAAILLAALAIYDNTRGAEGVGELASRIMADRGDDHHIWPSYVLILSSIIGLFIAHALVAAGDSERRVIAAYPAYFDRAWKMAVQLALSAAFVGLFWMLLALGAGLFKLIDIDVFVALIQRHWFAMPATTVALAAAFHVTDARLGIVRGLRVLVHVLLSWLLPLLTVVVAGFLATLPFTGLAPLWKTRFATALLLLATTALLGLINAAYQEGDAAHRPASLIRHAGRLAALMLVPLVAIAAYALGLRVGQHGWSSDRIITAAILVVVVFYALGYAAAALRRGAWLKGIETVNVASGFVILAVLLALLSPLADPAQLAVASQVARLKDGRIAPDHFDYAYLRFDGARYGRAALEELKAMEGPNAALIRQRVAAVEHLKNRWDTQPAAPDPAGMAAVITVHPSDRVLPESFLAQNWGDQSEVQWLVPLCLRNRSDHCDVFLMDLDGDGVEEVVVLDQQESGRAVVFHQNAAGRWRMVGTFSLDCEQFQQAFQSGEVRVVAPEWHDLEISGIKLRLTPTPAQCH
jgi:Domain of unknown function (DUF4153)